MEHSRPESIAVERTGELLCRARRLLAYGGLDGVVHRPLLDDTGRAFPHFAREAHGYELIDTTGISYVDWVNGWGPVLLGYRRPEIEQAIRAQLEAGPTLSLMHPIEVEVAAMLCEMVPCADMVAFGKNGSDVLTAAVRVARAVTGREVILQYGMHGFHDWYVCLLPNVRGVPEVLRPMVHPFGHATPLSEGEEPRAAYNDLAALERLFQRFSGHVAAVVMEPVRDILPRAGYLAGVRELTSKHGALLVFDEVVTAFRLANGGAQELYGVVPDLACLGKSLGNGMPLSALVGRREYMQYLPAVGFGMTFRGETLSLAAARAVLRFLREHSVADHLVRVGEEIREAFHRSCSRLGVRCRLEGPPSRMTFVFQEEPNLSSESLRSLFLQQCLRHGVFTNGNLLASFAHDGEAILRTVAALDASLEVVAETVRMERSAAGRESILDLRSILRKATRTLGFAGSLEPIPESRAPAGPRAMISSGFVETLREEKDGLHVSGWILLETFAPSVVDFLARNGVIREADLVERPDIATAFPNIVDAERAGYSVVLPPEDFARDGTYEFTIRALQGGRVRFSCQVLRQSGSSDSTFSEGPYPTSYGVLYV